KEVYQIIDNKWDFLAAQQQKIGQRANYRISDVPPGPNDIKLEDVTPKTRVITLAQAVALATAQNRDYQTQKESLYQKALDLTGERYKYALKWFGTIDTTYTDNKSNGDDVEATASGGISKSSLLLDGIIVNTRIAIDWARFLTGDPRTTIGSVLSGDFTVPLLGSGAGKVAWENLTQAERDVLYQIRLFNRFRKTFVVDIIDDYYSVLQQKDAVTNAENNYKMQEESKKRLDELGKAGRVARINVDEAEQSLLSAQNAWVRAQQRYEQALDQFKIKLALPTDADIELDPNELIALKAAYEAGLSEPNYTVDEAIETALATRLDLANSIDAVDDAVRKLELAAEGLGLQLNLVGSLDVSSPDKTRFTRLQFQRGIYSLGGQADLPLDRKNQRNAYREKLITLTQQQRTLENELDNVKLQVRNALRQLREQAESYRIQKLAVELAQRRVESNQLLLDAGRIEVRLLLDAQNALLAAQNAFTAALVDHTIAKLSFFRDVGILQVRPDGMWQDVAAATENTIGTPLRGNPEHNNKCNTMNES
ncbi:MAG: TolC family protein, partial [Sedimentisphaerales bacterium]